MTTKTATPMPGKLLTCMTRAAVEAHARELASDRARLIEELGNWRTWQAEHFEDFSSEINAQLLCLDNDSAALLRELEGKS